MLRRLHIWFLTLYLSCYDCELVSSISKPRTYAVFGGGKDVYNPRVKRAIEKLRALLEQEGQQ